MLSDVCAIEDVKYHLTISSYFSDVDAVIYDPYWNFPMNALSSLLWSNDFFPILLMICAQNKLPKVELNRIFIAPIYSK
jgi:hypothetical protein